MGVGLRDESLETAGFWLISEYVSKRNATIVDYVVGRPI